MNIAVFPGSFDPITKAHIDIVTRGLGLFDKIIVAVGVNSSKKSMFSIDERVQMIRVAFEDQAEKVIVEKFDGLTVDFCRKSQAKFILRGMRSAGDFEFERAIAQNNRDLFADIESVFLISVKEFSHISSTITREIITNDGDVTHLVPRAVVQLLNQRTK